MTENQKKARAIRAAMRSGGCFDGGTVQAPRVIGVRYDRQWDEVHLVVSGAVVRGRILLPSEKLVGSVGEVIV